MTAFIVMLFELLFFGDFLLFDRYVFLTSDSTSLSICNTIPVLGSLRNNDGKEADDWQMSKHELRCGCIETLFTGCVQLTGLLKEIGYKMEQVYKF
jgi:hypothetical protein